MACNLPLTISHLPLFFSSTNNVGLNTLSLPQAQTQLATFCGLPFSISHFVFFSNSAYNVGLINQAYHKPKHNWQYFGGCHLPSATWPSFPAEQTMQGLIHQAYHVDLPGILEIYRQWTDTIAPDACSSLSHS